MTDKFSWSYSALKTFLQCQLKYYLLKVTKEVKEDFSGPAIEFGNLWHKRIEDYINGSGGLRVKDPGSLSHLSLDRSQVTRLKEFLSKLSNLGEIQAETEITFDNQKKRVGWYDKKAWLRVKVDALVFSPDKTKVWVIDWKAGKRRPDEMQLAITALALFWAYPTLRQIRCSFYWLQDKTGDPLDDYVYTLDDLPEITEEVEDNLDKLRDSFDTQIWEPNDSALCRWCPVTSEHCVFAED